jgi:hypothetical protein
MKILTDSREVRYYLDANLVKKSFWTYSRELEDLRCMNGTGSEQDLLCSRGIGRDASCTWEVLHANRFLPFKKNSRDGMLRQNMIVRFQSR